MARIATVYYPAPTRFVPRDMSFIRWLKISEALARLGHEVDVVVDEPLRFGWWLRRPERMAGTLRRVPLRGIDFSTYDVVKTLFHTGYETFARHGGDQHPFVICKLGSVVGPRDMEGVYFYGDHRAWRFSVQQRMARTARYITVLSQPAAELWKTEVCADSKLLLVPGGVDREVPEPRKNPFQSRSERRCLFSGNIYGRTQQPQAHAVLVAKLNELGRHLRGHGVRLYFQGTGETSGLDASAVTILRPVSYEESWQAMHFADVGIVVSAGPFMHNNESTKIYHYLRAGLPVVSESGFPNDHVVTSSGLGWLVENENMQEMAERVAAAANARWDREAAVRYVVDHHSWDQRAAIYDEVIREELANSGH